MLAGLLQVHPERVTPEAYFVSDLGVDSLRMFHILLRLEEMGIPVALEAAGRIQTVSDAFDYYRRMVSEEHGPDRGAGF